MQRLYRPVLDTCDIETFTNADDLTEFDFGGEFTRTTAGETIVFSSPSGTYATLVSDSGSPVYTIPPADLTWPFPSGLSMSYPGFSSITGVDDLAVPDVDTMVTSSTSGFSDVNSVITWTARTSSSVFVELALFSHNNAQTTEVSCTVTDDGSFELPANAKAALQTGTVSQFVEIERVAYSVVQTGDMSRGCLEKIRLAYFSLYPSSRICK